MKKTYFLTAIFENKFGKAKKYYDGVAWHWMLNSDQPQLYESIDEAKQKARQLKDEDLMDLAIKEIQVYEEVWEHKIPRETISSFLEKNGQPRAVLFYQEQKNKYLFLSKEKQSETALLMEGLYCMDRKQDGWIYCMKKTETTNRTPKAIAGLNPMEWVINAYRKLEEAKALMVLLEEDSHKIEKINSLLLLMRKMIPSALLQATPHEEEGLTTSSGELLQLAVRNLEEAQKIAVANEEPEQTVEHITGFQLFCRRLL